MTRTVALRGAERERLSFITRISVRVLRIWTEIFTLLNGAASPVRGVGGRFSEDADCRRAETAGAVWNRRDCLYARPPANDECERRERRPVPRRCPRSRNNRRRRDAGGA